MKKKTNAVFCLLLCLLLLCGCGGSSKESAYDTEAYVYESPAEAPAAPAPTEEEMGGLGNTNGTAKNESQSRLQSEKIIYTAHAEVETVEYDETIEAVSAMVERLGGFIESSSVSGADYYRSSRGLTSLRSANYTLRIPAEHFEELTGSLSQLGNVPYCNTSSENVTASYYDVEARKTAYETQERRLLEMLEIAESVEDLLAIQQQLTEVQYEIDALQSRLTNYDRRVSYSTVHLSISEVEKYTETPEVKLSYGQKLAQRFESSCEDVADFFVDGSLWLLGDLPVLLLWAFGLFAGWKLFRKLCKHEKGERKSWKERRAEKKAGNAALEQAKEAEGKK